MEYSKAYRKHQAENMKEKIKSLEMEKHQSESRE